MQDPIIWDLEIYELNYDNLHNITFYGMPAENIDYLLKHHDFDYKDNYYRCTDTHLISFNDPYEIIDKSKIK